MNITVLNSIFNKTAAEGELPKEHGNTLVALLLEMNSLEIITKDLEITLNANLKFKVTKESSTEIRLNAIGEVTAGITEIILYTINTAIVSVKSEGATVRYLVNLFTLEPVV